MQKNFNNNSINKRQVKTTATTVLKRKKIQTSARDYLLKCVKTTKTPTVTPSIRRYTSISICWNVARILNNRFSFVFVSSLYLKRCVLCVCVSFLLHCKKIVYAKVKKKESCGRFHLHSHTRICLTLVYFFWLFFFFSCIFIRILPSSSSIFIDDCAFSLPPTSYYINYLTKAMQLEDPRIRYRQLQNEHASTESIPFQTSSQVTISIYLYTPQTSYFFCDFETSPKT